jgi:hypothetical protein
MKYEVFTNSDKSFKPMSKKLLFSFFLTLSVSLSVVGQISLDYTTSSHRGGVDLINTSSNGFKLIGTNYLRDTVAEFKSQVRHLNAG